MIVHATDPIDLAFQHRGKPLALRLRGCMERTETIDEIVKVVWLEGEVVGDLPDDWRLTDRYEIDAPEFSGLIRVIDVERGRFKSQGRCRVPALGADWSE